MAMQLHAAIQEANDRGSIYKVSRNLQRAKDGAELRFPKEPSDLFPSDPSMCIGGLLSRTAKADDIASSRFPPLSAMVKVCPSEGLPALIGSRDLVPVMSALVDYTLHATRSNGRLSQQHKDAWSKLFGVGAFFDNLKSFALSNIEFLAFATASGEHAFLGMCSSVLHAHDRPASLPAVEAA